MKPLVTPFEHQKDGARIIDEDFNGRALCADEMGLGKSMTAMLVACRRKTSRPILIVVPAGLKLNWAQELKEHMGEIPLILEGKPPADQGLIKAKIYIISASLIHKKPWRKYFRKLKAQFIVFDEAHYYKNPGTKRTKAAKKIVRRVRDVLFLGGTPMTRSPADLFPILNMLRPKLYPSFRDFVMEYTKAKRKWYGWDYSGGKNLKKLNEELRTHLMVRRLKADVLDLPAKSVHVVPMPISNRSEYEFAQSDLISWLATWDKKKAVAAQRNEDLVRFGYLKRLTARLKLPYVFEWVDNFLASSKEKIILFAIHKAIVFDLKARYRDISVVIDGSKSGVEKKRAETVFNDDKKCRILIGNIEAAGVGLNLQKSCCTSAFIELAWIPNLHSQAMDRTDRIGQTKPTSNYFLVAHDTIEEYLCEIIQERNEMSNQVLDGHGKINRMNVIDLLKKKLGRM